MPNHADTPRSQYLVLSEQLIERAKLMRDYASTPGNVWLARAELSKIMQLAIELENLLAEIKQAEA